MLAVLSPLLAGLLLIVPLTYYAVRNGLKPLRELEQQIGQRSSSDLHAVVTTDVPVEVVPVVSALNLLLQQLGAAIEKEKRITADAAHELQTPLASIKTKPPGVDGAAVLPACGSLRLHKAGTGIAQRADRRAAPDRGTERLSSGNTGQ
jgi:signal transduction histidine kinase